MKKFIIIFVVCAVIVTICLTFTACGLFGDGGALSKNKTSTITVYNESSSSSYDLTIGKEAHIEPVFKSGYYLTGFFDKASGGTMYFDVSGDSTSVWQKDYPTTFYAQWDEIKNLETMKWDGYYDSDYYLGESKTFPFNVSKPLSMNAVQGNYDKSIEIMFQIRISTEDAFAKVGNDEKNDYKIEFCNKSGDGREAFATKTLSTVGHGWHDFKFTVTCPAKIFKGDLSMSVCISGRYRNGWYTIYMKEIRMEIRFI